MTLPITYGEYRALLDEFTELVDDYSELEMVYDEMVELFDELLDEHMELEEFGEEAFNAYMRVCKERDAVERYADVLESEAVDTAYLEAKVSLLEAQLATANEALDWYREAGAVCFANVMSGYQGQQ